MPYFAKDLAKELGISTATVSLALNNKPGIGKNRREQILKLANERGLTQPGQQNRLSHNIGFVVFVRSGLHANNTSFFSLMLNSASNTASKYGYNLVMLHYDISMPAAEQIKQINVAECCGLIIIATEAVREDYKIFCSFDLPFVILDNTLFSNRIDTICINNSLGIQTAFQYLFDLGHRDIGYFRSKSEINSFSERLKNYQHCMEERRLPIRSNYVIPLSYMGKNNAKEIQPFLDSGGFPTAFLSDNDFIALGAKESLIALGLHVPNDVSIIGFDNRDFGELYHPTLTTLSLPTDYFGKLAVDTLINRIDNKMLPPTLIAVGATLIKRESTIRFVKEVDSDKYVNNNL
jgi:DNA-binding LacI/PurR family transcriptional regulator